MRGRGVEGGRNAKKAYMYEIGSKYSIWHEIEYATHQYDVYRCTFHRFIDNEHVWDAPWKRHTDKTKTAGSNYNRCALSLPYVMFQRKIPVFYCINKATEWNER